MDRNPPPSLFPTLGRVLISALFLYAGYGKAMDATGTIAYIASSGAPLPQVGYGIALLAEIGGGLAILFGFLARPVAFLLALFTVATAVMFHADQAQAVEFLKNLAITGGLLQIAAYGAGGFSIDHALNRS